MDDNEIDVKLAIIVHEDIYLTGYINEAEMEWTTEKDDINNGIIYANTILILDYIHKKVYYNFDLVLPNSSETDILGGEFSLSEIKKFIEDKIFTVIRGTVI